MQNSSLVYSSKEKSSVLVSTLLGYGLDFYNILIISFIMGAIQKSAANSASGIAGGMMAGLAAAIVCALAALLLPETAGRSFAVIETKVRAAI